ncbi:MAG: 2-C-methyl-D-erythritol 4-phosphate cytidylyltransferase [Bacteroides sp.]|nr:2-C-methyl-D-erythritol 4-phosphate cytidylyltransferase [Bacteroides sp.]
MSNAVVVVAGGKGLRMGQELPKQFLPLGGRPVLMHTLEVFHAYDPCMEIVLVLPQAQQPYWSRLCRQYDFAVPHRIADGGETRFHSVKNGLARVGDASLTGVHDGVRPFVSPTVIGYCYHAARDFRAVVPVIPVVDTVRQVEGEDSHTVDREAYRLVQTPQVFHTSLLRQAYEQEYTSSFTDDASVVEALGETIHLVEGNRENIKITTPFDLKIASALLPCST